MTPQRKQIVLDTETTGLKTEEGHRIVEIGCVEIKNRVLTGNTYHQYINPKRSIDNDALAIHGITEKFLKDKPLFHEIAENFYQFIKGADLIIHNAPFDIGFLEYEFNLMKAPYKRINKYCKIIDTLPMARRLHPGQRNSLDALLKRYEIDGSKRDAEGHGALLDAELLAQVYLAMTTGQVSLFESIETENEMEQKTIMQSKQIYHQITLPIISANSDEIRAHQKFLKFLHEKSGKDRDNSS